MLLRTKQSVIAVEKTLKYQLNESYAEGFDDAREFIAKGIENYTFAIGRATIPENLTPEAKPIWKAAQIAFAEMARKLK